MKNDTDALKKALDGASIEEQKTIIEEFMVASTDKSVLEGIRIANESYTTTDQCYVVSCHVEE